jgi:hypothetical protein
MIVEIRPWRDAVTDVHGRAARLLRPFVGRNLECRRRTVVEQIRDLTRRHGRRIDRLRPTSAAAGLALAGQVGVGPALAGQVGLGPASVFGFSVSRCTMLRLVGSRLSKRRCANERPGTPGLVHPHHPS